MTLLDVPQPISILFTPKEAVLWTGTPDPSLLALTGFDYFQSIGGLAFIGMILAGQFSTASDQQLGFVLIAIPAIILGLYFVFGRLFVSQHFRRSISYVLTDRCAYIYSNVRQHNVMRERVTPNLIVQYWPGTKATIRFGKSYPDMFRLQKIGWWPTHMEQFEFFRIADGDHVMSLIRQMQEERV